MVGRLPLNFSYLPLDVSLREIAVVGGELAQPAVVDREVLGACLMFNRADSLMVTFLLKSARKNLILFLISQPVTFDIGYG